MTQRGPAQPRFPALTGLDILEYALSVALIVLAVFAVIAAAGNSVRGIFQKVAVAFHSIVHD